MNNEMLIREKLRRKELMIDIKIEYCDDTEVKLNVKIGEKNPFNLTIRQTPLTILIKSFFTKSEHPIIKWRDISKCIEETEWRQFFPFYFNVEKASSLIVDIVRSVIIVMMN